MDLSHTRMSASFQEPPQGVLLVDKPSGCTSFSIVYHVRKKTKQPTVGHAGTLDPFATGLLVVLLGRTWTRASNTFLHSDKSYRATICLGAATDTFDRDGTIMKRSAYEPSMDEVCSVVAQYQGEVLQTPPMFSAKKVAGKRLYELARKGIEVERKPQLVTVFATVERYVYPTLVLHFSVSKGAYIRSFVHEIGERLTSYAYTQELRRLHSGSFHVEKSLTMAEFDALDQAELQKRLLTPTL